MPTICMFRGIKIYINWRDHMPPHFHAKYGDSEVIVSINDIEVLEGTMPNKQLKMLLGWAAFHQEELKENWELAVAQQELFTIEPLKKGVIICRKQLNIIYHRDLTVLWLNTLQTAERNLLLSLRKVTFRFC